MSERLLSGGAAPAHEFDSTSFSPKDLVEGVGKTLNIIEAFDDDHPRMTASEVGHRCGLSRAAARRYLLSFCHYGYATTDGHSFSLLPRILRLGHSYLTSARMPRLVQPFIQRISSQSGETVNVSVLDGHDVLYVARSNSPRVLSIGFHPGDRAPAHVVTPGTAILSTWDDEALDDWLAEHEFVKFNSRTVIDKVDFRQQVLAARSLGYWIVEQQLELGLQGIAVPVLDRKGHCVASIGMTVQASQFDPPAMQERLLPLLYDAAKDLRPLL